MKCMKNASPPENAPYPNGKTFTPAFPDYGSSQYLLITRLSMLTGIKQTPIVNGPDASCPQRQSGKRPPAARMGPFLVGPWGNKTSVLLSSQVAKRWVINPPGEQRQHQVGTCKRGYCLNLKMTWWLS